MTIFLYCLLGAAFGFSYIRDRNKTKMSIQLAVKIFRNMLPSVIMVVVLVGLVVGLLSEELIIRYIGPETGFTGTLTAALVGAVTLIPSLVSFPLAASLLRMGASVITIAAFITTLTMVGFVTAPLEIKELGLKFTLWRNGLSFIFALSIALVMGVALK